MKRPTGNKYANLTAFIYLRLSVDKEDGKAQSIDAQRTAAQDYCKARGIRILGEFVDMGLSGQTDRRPEFRRMVAEATGPDHPVDLIVMYMFSRIARNMRLFFNTLGDLEDAGVDVVSITEDFGEGRGKRLGRAISAMVAEQQAVDASILTRKSRRENARQGFWNGGPVPCGYRSYVARQDGEKSRMKLEIEPGEAAIVRQIFDWADSGRGGRWIVRTLNTRGDRLLGSKFSNSNVSGILSRAIYTGTYYDRTADDDGNIPEIEDAIPVTCPVIIDQEQFERVAALRATRNPRKTAPHIAAGTTLLAGIASCGMPGCGSGMTIRTGKGGRYAYYCCNARVNRGGSCTCPSVRREKLDDMVLDLLERRLLDRQRLRELLADVLRLSDDQRQRREDELARARSEQTRLRSAVERLLILVEQGDIGPRDPIFADRMATNRAHLATVSARIDTLEAQLARGTARITEESVDRFGDLLKAKLRGDDKALRSSYIRMFVSDVRVAHNDVIVSGPMAALEAGIATGKPVVPSFDRKWCRLQDSNL